MINPVNIPNSKEALIAAELDWRVGQQGIKTSEGIPLKGYKAKAFDMMAA